ncbi:glycosyltransferase family 4 protein [Metabacillus sp. cB07]|uniref:glycosyltransferase family 4 protein n=1 Tax=Metabacillus sp. cB07 TaxID=2806989 RepID=UPI00193A71C0|nr:glycosyltransferase family 4 protein [Metabacillus sp. cB07]
MHKILIVSRFGKMGGVRTFHNNLISFCIKNNHRIYIIFLSNTLDSTQVNILKEHNIHYKILNDPPYPGIFRKLIQNFHILFLILSYCKKYEISKIIFTQWGIMSDFSTIFLAGLKKELLFFVHSTAKEPKKFKGLFKIIKYLFSKLVGDNKLITVSNFNKEEIIKNWSVKNKNVNVLYNYSSITTVSHQKDETKIVLTLGHLREYKNPMQWIEVAKRVTSKKKNVKFIWAGEGELFNECRAITKNNSNIEFIGFVKNVEELYKHADIYLQLSLEETQGISVLDAMKNSIPCIVSNKGGLPESVKDNYSGYVVDLENTSDIEEKVLELLKNDKLRQTMGESSSKLYTEYFSKTIWESNIYNLLK